MARLCLINREKKRQALVDAYSSKRKEIKLALKDTSISWEEKINLRFELQKLPRNSNPTRLRNRCILTGRPRGYFRRFGMSRSKLRELIMQGAVPGVCKASW